MAKQRDLPKKYEAGFITKMDRRFDLTKRLNHTFDALLADVGGHPTTAQQLLIERLVFQSEFLRKFEEQIVNDPVGQTELMGRYVQCCNGMLGLIRTLKLDERDKRQDALDALYEPLDATETPEDAP